MDIQRLSKDYTVRELNEADIEKVYDLMQGNPMYFQYCPPVATYDSISKDMHALPPRTVEEDKFYIGYFEDNQLVAVMDLILNFPNNETAFIGFFMMDKKHQGNGIGSKMVTECGDYLKECGYQHIRLGFAKGNPQSESFWTKNGFVRTGIEDVQELYTVVVMEKAL